MQFILAIALAIILYIAQNSYYKKHWKEHLTTSISYNKSYANIGEVIELKEQIENRKLLPLPVLYVKFSTSRTFQFDDMDNASVSDCYHRNDVFSILGNQQITRTLRFCTTKRGYYVTDSINLVVNDLFLRDSYAEKLDNHTSLYVYPALLNNHYSLTLANSISGEMEQQELFEDPLSFRSIREYTSQDSMRYINWKATAKKQSLMVNTFFDTQNKEAVLLLNLDMNTIQRDDKLQEYILCITATLLHHLNSKGFALRLAINIPDPFTGEPVLTELGKDIEHLHLLMQILARLDLSKELTPITDFFDGANNIFQKNHTDTTYLLISNYRKEQILSLYNQKQEQGYKMQFICPEITSRCIPVPNIRFWEVDSYEI